MKSGRPFPPWDRQPTLSEELQMVRDAWMELDTCRERGMGLGPIPWTAIEDYAEREGWIDRKRFHALIRQMDREYLAQQNKRVRDETRGRKEG